MNYKEALNLFISEMKYIENSEVEGIIFYGSYQTGVNNAYSDIDVMILFNDDSEIEQIKGYKNVAGFPVEYFERSISKIYERASSDYMKCEDTLNSVIGYGEIVFDRNGKVKELKEYIKEKYSRALPGYTKHEAKYNVANLKRQMDEIKELKEQNDLFFESAYFLTVENIRDFYHKLNGYSNLSRTKIIKIYTDSRIRNAQKKVIPEQKFIDLYFSTLEENIDKATKVIRLEEFLNYCIRNHDIDMEDVRINIGRKRY